MLPYYFLYADEDLEKRFHTKNFSMTDSSDSTRADPSSKEERRSRRVPESDPTILSGTTLRVYRFLYRQGGRPAGYHEIQRGLGLSAPSLAQYHVRKLVDAGLVREQDSGYVVDRVLFENMIRIRRSIVPLQVTFSIFFLTTLILLLTLLRPHDFSATYSFSIAVNAAAFALFAYEAVRASKKNAI